MPSLIPDRFACGEASSPGTCTNRRFKDGRAGFPQEWRCRGRPGWSADRQRECTRLSVRRTGRPSGPAHTADVRTLEQSELYVADAPAILAADPTVALYVAAILARRLDAANRWLVAVKRQLQTGEPPSVIGKAIEQGGGTVKLRRPRSYWMVICANSATSLTDQGARAAQSYRLRLLENTKLQSSMSWLGRSFIFTALRISQMSMPCLLADLMMQFLTYFWRFRQCQLNFMPFASALHAAVAFSRATLSASDSFFAASAGVMQSFKNALLSEPLSFCSFGCFRQATDFAALCSSCWVGLMLCATRSDFDVASDELCALAGSPASHRTITKILADTKRRSMSVPPCRDQYFATTISNL